MSEVEDVLRERREAEATVYRLVAEALSRSSSPARDAAKLLLYCAGPAEAVLGRVREAAALLLRAES